MRYGNACLVSTVHSPPPYTDYTTTINSASSVGGPWTYGRRPGTSWTEHNALHILLGKIMPPDIRF